MDGINFEIAALYHGIVKFLPRLFCCHLSFHFNEAETFSLYNFYFQNLAIVGKEFLQVVGSNGMAEIAYV